MAFWFLKKPVIDPFALKIEEHDHMRYSFLLTGGKTRVLLTNKFEFQKKRVEMIDRLTIKAEMLPLK